MHIFDWVISYLFNLLLWLWIVRWGGAEWLENAFESRSLIDIWPSEWSVEVTKLVGWISLIITTAIFLIGLFSQEIRQELSLIVM